MRALIQDELVLAFGDSVIRRWCEAVKSISYRFMIFGSAIFASAATNAVVAGEQEMDIGQNAAHIESAILHCKEYIEIDFEKLEAFQQRWDQAINGLQNADVTAGYDLTFEVMRRSRERSAKERLSVYCMIMSQILDDLMKSNNPIGSKAFGSSKP